MLNIAICEDHAAEAAAVEKMLARYQARNPHLQIRVDVFHRTENLIAALNEEDPYHLYLLDVIMPGMDGISLAKSIRSSRHQPAIVFITQSKEFALEAFSVRAADYLLKPVQEKSLYKALDHAVALLGSQVETYTMVQTAGSERRVRVSDIVCVEVMGHCLCYCLAGGERILSKVLRISFEKAARELIEDVRFIRPHRSFLINAAYVKKFTKAELIMENNLSVPISRLRFPAVKQEYMGYLIKTETPLGSVLDVPH